jgi:hypothetical protein|tara:strand:- start:119 stop:451 length:333 start_codon:yes stop_codon:yes gene_type:complete
MSQTIDNITSHFDSLNRRSLHVPEWNVTVYSTPVTIGERNRIYKGNKGDNDFDTIINILIVKALDEAGKALFTIADRPALLNKADSSLVAKLAAHIMGSDAPNADELKNE